MSHLVSRSYSTQDDQRNSFFGQIFKNIAVAKARVQVGLIKGKSFIAHFKKLENDHMRHMRHLVVEDERLCTEFNRTHPQFEA